MKRLKQWVSKKLKQIINSKAFLFLIALIIGGTTVFNYLEGKELYQELFAIKTVYIAQASGEGVQANSHQAVRQAEVITTHGEGEAETNPSQLAIKDKIKQAFPENPELALKVAECESQFENSRIGDTDKTYYKNGKMYGDSIGLFQIRTFEGRPDREQLKDVDFNIKYARELYDKSGWRPWSCARILGIV